jgi:hypothetical protein
MGKAWAPAVASLYMGKWDALFLARVQVKPIYFRRYIDDLLLLFPTRDAAESALAAVHTLDANIRVGECQIDTSVHFLDLNLSLSHAVQTLDNVRVNVSLYRKPTDLIAVLHFRSAHSWRVKYNTLLGQLVRISRLTNISVSAGHNIRVLLECMCMFRCLPKRTFRRLHLRMLYSFASHTLSRLRRSDDNQAVCAQPVNMVRGIPCSLPFSVNEKRIHDTLKYVYELVPPYVRRYVGRPLIRRQTESRLQQLLSS